MSTTLLRATGLTVRFGGVTAVDHVDLEVFAGETVALVGPNGSGKTTFLNAVLGYLPYEGTVEFDGRRFQAEPPHRRVATGMARSFQHVDMYERLTVGQVVKLGFHVSVRQPLHTSVLRTPGQRRSERELDRTVADVLESLGLPPSLVGQQIAELPYGVRKMVDVARVVASNPKIVFLDEPSSGVSSVEREEIVALLRSLRGRGTTTVLIEHDMSIVERLADRLVALNFGTKIAEGSFAEVSGDELLQQIYFDSGSRSD